MNRTSGQSKRFRSQWTPEQLNALEEKYQENPYIDGEERDLFAKRIGLGSLIVKVWFKNRRAKAQRTGETVPDKPSMKPNASFSNNASDEKLKRQSLRTTKKKVPILGKKDVTNHLQKKKEEIATMEKLKKECMMTTHKMVPLLDRNEVPNYFQRKSQGDKEENKEREDEDSTDEDVDDSESDDEDFIIPARKRKRCTTKALTSGRSKRFRSQWTPEQLNALEERYQQNSYIGGEERDLLSQRIGLDSLTVKVWFKNRRAKSIRTRETITGKPCKERNVSTRTRSSIKEASKTDESTDADWDQFVALYNVDEEAEEAQTFSAMYQPVPTAQYQITEDESILDEDSDGEVSEGEVSDGEDSEEEFMFEGDEHEVSDSEDSEEEFVNEEEMQEDGLFFVHRGQNRTVVNKMFFF